MRMKHTATYFQVPFRFFEHVGSPPDIDTFLAKDEAKVATSRATTSRPNAVHGSDGLTAVDVMRQFSIGPPDGTTYESSSSEGDEIVDNLDGMAVAPKEDLLSDSQETDENINSTARLKRKVG